MKLNWFGLDWGENSYFYWFDWIGIPANRLIGYEKIFVDTKWHYMLCFWWFCIVWSW